jgi:hypothetical protein
MPLRSNQSQAATARLRQVVSPESRLCGAAVRRTYWPLVTAFL